MALVLLSAIGCAEHPGAPGAAIEGAGPSAAVASSEPAGDGLETIEIDPETSTVLRCVDGDGTVLEDSSCPCAPEIADAYSAAARAELVPTTVIGVY